MSPTTLCHRTLKAAAALALLTSLAACVTLPGAGNDPYNRLSAQECYGEASLGDSYRCIDGRWVEEARLPGHVMARRP